MTILEIILFILGLLLLVGGASRLFVRDYLVGALGVAIGLVLIFVSL